MNQLANKFRVKIGITTVALLSLLGAQGFAQNTPKPLMAKDVCADDYWKWCSPGESPFDCFKRRGFFKSESMLSLECKKAWSKTKVNEDPQPAKETPTEQAQTTSPQKLRADPKRIPSAAEPPKELPKKDEKTSDSDDFSDLEFQ